MVKDSHDFPWTESLAEDAEVYKEELTRSYEVVKKLLPFLAKRGIPVTPANFRLFHDYIIFVNPELNKILNELLEKNVKFYHQVSDSLYSHFYTGIFSDHHADLLSQVTDTFINVSNNISESLQNTRVQHSHFHEVLSSTSRQMADIDPPKSLQPFLNDLMAETRQTLAAADVFSNLLKEANEVIAGLKEELKSQTDLARVDELTKLNNRHHLSLEAPRLIRDAIENGKPFSAIVFDIDFFKKVNDTWGHLLGDKVLVTCADIIKKAARSSDLAVRLGGEEFLLLCANINLVTATRVADRVRQSISSTEITIQSHRLSVTVSGGVAEYQPGEDLSALIARADDALYQAKDAGRNCIRVAEIVPPQPEAS